MILGTGIDIIEVARIQKAVERWGDVFLNYFFCHPAFCVFMWGEYGIVLAIALGVALFRMLWSLSLLA